MTHQAPGHNSDDDARTRRVLVRLAERGLFAELAAAAARFGVSAEQIAGRDKAPPIVRARHAWWSALREKHGKSYPEIGTLCEVDHRTVMSGITQDRRRQGVAA